MDDLVEFLLSRIAEDEAVAREAGGLGPVQSFEGGDGNWCSSWLHHGIRHLVRNVDIECPAHEYTDASPNDCGQPHRYAGEHIARWDPARVLAECNAKRQIINEFKWDTMGPGRWVLRTLAQPYKDHPDFDF